MSPIATVGPVSRPGKPYAFHPSSRAVSIGVGAGSEGVSAGADWQLQAYGNTRHAFTNPAANDRDMGTVYDATADRRSWTAMQNFLAEIFAD